MCTAAYVRLESESLFVSEGSPQEDYSAEPVRPEWKDDEIALIRTVLQRLTALRITNATDAEDLVQDTLLTLISKNPANELQKGLLVWSMGILRNKVGNYYRKIHRGSRQKEKEAYVQQSLRQSRLSVSPERRLVQEELHSIVERTLTQLPPPQRAAMELLLAGFDAGEIARKLHPERYQNVINHLYRGRKRMARELAKYGYGPNRSLKMAKGKGGKPSRPQTGLRFCEKTE